MKTGTKNKGIGAITFAATLGVVSLGLSSLFVPAFAARVNDSLANAPEIFFDQFTPAGVDTRLAEKFEQHQKAANVGHFPFTPAGVGLRNRTLTVAARSQPLSGNSAVSIRNSLSTIKAGRRVGRLNKTEFRLTSAKGWQGFSLVPQTRPAVKAPLVTDLGKSSFRLDKGPRKKPSRFKPDIAVDRDRSVTPAVRGNAATKDYKLDVGGSFKISRKIDVTAGVRYTSERDRIAPSSDDRQDSEAVYVGTKIRF
ncbi:MAG: hypothetical protein V3V15_10660 [Sphingorhabdus sp.]